MLLTVLLIVAAVVLLGVSGLALWEFWSEVESDPQQVPMPGSSSAAPTPPTLDRERRVAVQRPSFRSPRPPTPIPPPGVRHPSVSYPPAYEEDEEDEDDLDTVMAFSTDYLSDEDDGETVVVNAEEFLYGGHVDE
jgi:hypothetical protein